MNISARVSLMNGAKTRRRLRRDLESSVQALIECKKYEPEHLFLVALALYWGEGDKKTRHQVRITNTDPGVLRIFYGFLKRYEPDLLNRVWASILLYPEHDHKTELAHWSSVIGLPEDRFQKIIVIQGKGRSVSAHGVCTLGVSSVHLKQKMLVWIDELRKKL